MSSINITQNNNTSTSNLRSEKSKAKKPAATKTSVVKTVTQDSDILSSQVEGNIILSVVNDVSDTSNAIVNNDINIATDDASNASEISCESNTKKSSDHNVWKLRQQIKDANDANDALLKVEELAKELSKANTMIEKLSKSTKVAAAPVAIPEQTLSKGYTTIQKKQYVKKVSYTSNTPSDDVSESHTGDKKPYVQRSTYKQPTPEEAAYRVRKAKAFDLAQESVSTECMNLFNRKVVDETNNGLQYIINYRRTLILKYDTDAICVEVEGETFEYSRTRFLENRHFQNNIRAKCEQKISDAWLRFFPGRDEGSYCIGIQKRRENTYSSA